MAYVWCQEFPHNGSWIIVLPNVWHPWKYNKNCIFSVAKLVLPKAIATATYLTNHLPTKAWITIFLLTRWVNMFLTPRVFGCVVYTHHLKRARNKFEPRVVNCVFIGYKFDEKGYWCLDPIQNQIYTTIDCDFVLTFLLLPLTWSSEGDFHWWAKLVDILDWDGFGPLKASR